eukprot:jgi/Bigna1/90261/estExt_fgenesh1_pg.C_660054
MGLSVLMLLFLIRPALFSVGVITTNAQIMCGAGHKLNGDQCLPCSLGEYQPYSNHNNTSCQVCPGGGNMITGTKGYTFIRASESPQACYYLQPLAARSVAVIRIIWMTIWSLSGLFYLILFFTAIIDCKRIPKLREFFGLIVRTLARLHPGIYALTTTDMALLTLLFSSAVCKCQFESNFGVNFSSMIKRVWSCQLLDIGKATFHVLEENAFVAAGQGFRQCIAGFLWKFKVSVLVNITVSAVLFLGFIPDKNQYEREGSTIRVDIEPNVTRIILELLLTHYVILYSLMVLGRLSTFFLRLIDKRALMSRQSSKSKSAIQPVSHSSVAGTMRGGMMSISISHPPKPIRLEPLEKFFRDRSFCRKLVFMIGEFVPNAVPTHHHHHHHSKHRRKKSTSSGTGSKSSLSGIGSKSTLSGIGGSSNARTDTSMESNVIELALGKASSVHLKTSKVHLTPPRKRTLRKQRKSSSHHALLGNTPPGSTSPSYNSMMAVDSDSNSKQKATEQKTVEHADGKINVIDI